MCPRLATISTLTHSAAPHSFYNILRWQTFSYKTLPFTHASSLPKRPPARTDKKPLNESQFERRRRSSLKQKR